MLSIAAAAAWGSRSEVDVVTLPWLCIVLNVSHLSESAHEMKPHPIPESLEHSQHFGSK